MIRTARGWVCWALHCVPRPEPHRSGSKVQEEEYCCSTRDRAPQRTRLDCHAYYRQRLHSLGALRARLRRLNSAARYIPHQQPPRMQMRRFTRLTTGYSKKIENHIHMVALYTVWYNWIRTHKAHRVTPAMAAGLTTS